ncbi:hypothetical protein I601_3048 [Nocardioides dokdonensis FR1436]|uniref:Cellulose synthase n=1 Tax=Nocardioides dokdonensis FR1436 TaxID=1300347 RepID=A0A1A9GMF1_9ACTN|nr:hypothetical protein [Nocardioides dokdonensis]ANH39459.1 hypothetical protein I601_3048 [Nocardioides dokdonensis FR1436]
MDEAAWTALAITLTVLGGLYTVVAWRRRGLVPAMRGAALTLLVPAAYLTRTLRMFTRIADAVTDWALGLVFSPAVWTGVALAGVSALLLVGARLLTRRRQRTGTPLKAGRREKAGKPVEPGRGDRPAAVEQGGKGRPAIDDDLADIEALLRKRGIS